MADGGSEVGLSSLSSQDKGSKNKRKLFDPSMKNLINLHSSLTEFPWYEQSSKKSQNPSSNLVSLGTKSSRSKEVARGEECESVDWDDPIVCALEELLSAGLFILFRDAIMRIVECGYSEEDAEKSISRHGLYCGGKDLVSNVVDDALVVLKEGKGVYASRDEVFEDLKQLVDCTMLEMINVLKVVNPSLSIVEAMWWLLMCDLNVSQACTAADDLLNFLDGKEALGERSSCSTCSPLGSEAQSSVTIPPNTKKSNIPKPSNPIAQSFPAQTLKFGSLNSPEPRNKRRDSLVMVAQSVEKSLSLLGERVQNMSLTLASEERSGTGQKRRFKKELATLQQKSFHGHTEKTYKAYGKGTFKSGKLSTIGGFVVENRVKPLIDLPAVQSKSGASKNSTEPGAIASSADGNHCASTSTPLAFPVPDSSSAIPTKRTRSALTASNIEHAASFSSETHPATKAESCIFLSPMMPDFYAGIPFDESLGKYVPWDEKEELLLKLVPQARLKEERMAKEKLCAQAASIRREQEQLEAATKANEEMMKLKAEKELKKYTVDIKKLEGQISLLKYKSDSSKIAALQGSMDGGFGCFLPGGKSATPAMMGNQIPGFSMGDTKFLKNVATGGLKQEQECVMCLAEEKSVVFLPCAHQVLCPKCNELHEKEGVKDCPSCRTSIQRRISVCFARP